MPVDESALRKALEKCLERKGKRGFKQSVEMVVVLRDVDPKSPEGRIREVVFLRRGLGKERRVCVVAEGDMALKAKELGVPVITRRDLQEMQGDRKKAKKVAEECDWVLVRTDLMAIAGRVLGPALGPRGKIPVPVPPNADIRALIGRYKSAIIVRTKDQPQVMCKIGSEDMSVDELLENALAVLSALEGKLKSPHNIARIYFKTTMGQPVLALSR